MELFEGLISRRSIRKYTGERIDEAKIKEIIKAGMYAPSARNKRPWHFIER
jgi:nitroreductase